MTAAIGTLALALVATAALAQSPSFSGKWTLVPDPNAAAGGGRGRGGRGGGFGSLCGMECTIAQDAGTLTVTRTTQAGEVKAVYKLDGSESKNSQTFGQGGSIESTSKASWDGAKLSISTTTDFNGNSIESKSVVSLDASGNLVIERTAPGFGGGGPTTTTQTYKKS
jgi:hypothetical protein